MPKAKKSAAEPALGYEAQLWQMADALRNNMDAAEYKCPAAAIAVHV